MKTTALFICLLTALSLMTCKKRLQNSDTKHWNKKPASAWTPDTSHIKDPLYIIDVSGQQGGDGSDGNDGYESDSKRSNDGGYGENGHDGRNGAVIRLNIGYTDASRKQFFIEGKTGFPDSGWNKVEKRIFDFNAPGFIYLRSNGGKGGNGGNGGNGINEGWPGSGGNGGEGGSAGSITIDIKENETELLWRFKWEIFRGPGGEGGKGGLGSFLGKTKNGRDGEKGNDGYGSAIAVYTTKEDGERIASHRDMFEIEVMNYHFEETINDDIFEPGEKIKLNLLRVCNKKKMPTPKGQPVMMHLKPCLSSKGKFCEQQLRDTIKIAIPAGLGEKKDCAFYNFSEEEASFTIPERKTYNIPGYKNPEYVFYLFIDKVTVGNQRDIYSDYPTISQDSYIPPYDIVVNKVELEDENKNGFYEKGERVFLKSISVEKKNKRLLIPINRKVTITLDCFPSNYDLELELPLDFNIDGKYTHVFDKGESFQIPSDTDYGNAGVIIREIRAGSYSKKDGNVFVSKFIRPPFSITMKTKGIFTNKKKSIPLNLFINNLSSKSYGPSGDINRKVKVTVEQIGGSLPKDSISIKQNGEELQTLEQQIELKMTDLLAASKATPLKTELFLSKEAMIDNYSELKISLWLESPAGEFIEIQKEVIPIAYTLDYYSQDIQNYNIECVYEYEKYLIKSIRAFYFAQDEAMIFSYRKNFTSYDRSPLHSVSSRKLGPFKTLFKDNRLSRNSVLRLLNEYIKPSSNESGVSGWWNIEKCRVAK